MTSSELVLLYVEDEESIRERLGRVLKRRYVDVIFASHGKEGLERYKDASPDIIITDINMPTMNGFEMISHIRSINPEIPIIITTAHNETEFLLKAIELGISHFVIKPVNNDKLIEAVELCAKNVLLKREIHAKNTLLTEYKNAIDDSTIVSKTTPEGVITYANEAFCSVSGYELHELIGQKHNIVSSGEVPPEAYRSLWGNIRNKKIWRGIFCNKTKQGDIYYISSTISPILNEQGNIIEYIGISHDVSELQNYRLRLQERVNEEVSKNRLKDIMLQQQSSLATIGEMVNSIAHQWRQPLNAINLITSNIAIDIELGEASHETIESCDKIMKLTENMSQTITDFMDFFNPKKETENFALRGLFDSIYNLIESNLFKRNIQWINNIPSTLHLTTHKNYIWQGCVNIINNAIQALENIPEENHRIITLDAYQSFEALIITIHDNAGGIPESIKDKIFEPYFTTKPKGVGTGIGLSLTRTLLTGLNMSLDVENRNEGACFIITIPLKKETHD